MTKQEAKQKAEVMLAWADGSEVEYKNVYSSFWHPYDGHQFDWCRFDYRIKPKEFPAPPEGESWHNPDNLTPEQVGEGYRLLLESEIIERRKPIAFIDRWLNKEWNGASWWGSVKSRTYRAPLSTPFHWDKPKEPEPPKMIPLSPEDIVPGSAIRAKTNPLRWRLIASISTGPHEIQYADGCCVGLNHLFNSGAEILRPGSTVWEPCCKPEQKG